MIVGVMGGKMDGVRIESESDGALVPDLSSDEESIMIEVGSLGGLGVALCFLCLESNLSAQLISLRSG